MDKIISKELLNVVLSHVTVKEVLQGKIDDNIYYKIQELDILQAINIYELAFDRCMEYTFKNKYYLNIDKTCCEVWKDGILVNNLSSGKKPKDSKAYISVIKACQWIYDNERN